MNKQAIFIFALITIFITAFLVGMSVNSTKEEQNIAQTNKINIINQNTSLNEVIETSIVEEKTTPNTVLTLNKYYTECKHTISSNASLPNNMVNLNKEEISANYPDWNIDEFSKDEIKMSKKIEGFCKEHYLLKEEEGNINIYEIDENGEKTLKEKTELSVEYLTETDKITLKNGIIIYGKDELNKIIEDFE